MAISVLYFFFMDWIKCVIYHRWNFELTARLWPVKSRRNKLEARQKQQVIEDRVRKHVDSARKVLPMIRVCKAMGGLRPLPEEAIELGSPPAEC